MGVARECMVSGTSRSSCRALRQQCPAAASTAKPTQLQTRLPGELQPIAATTLAFSWIEGIKLALHYIHQSGTLPSSTWITTYSMTLGANCVGLNAEAG